TLAAFSATARGPYAARAQDEPEDRVVVHRFLMQDAAPLVSYEARRQLSVVARGGKMQAALTATTSLDADGDFQYQVLEESGSGFLRSRVLHPILEAEQEAKRRAKGTHGALTTANYTFTAGERTPQGLLRVGITPKRKDDLLVDGSIFLTCADSDLVRLEGLLVKRPSFWTRKVRIVRDYGRVAGIRVPLAMGSTADVLFVGQSTFTMTYEYTAINGARLPPDAAPAISPSR
ncbi:MAG TPA: hypothetical protein VFJ02_07540, partial [Vicinamibacterales bacterium]|nr:hypothetical protein [Vicinamibacterales bacterium]